MNPKPILPHRTREGWGNRTILSHRMGRPPISTRAMQLLNTKVPFGFAQGGSPLHRSSLRDNLFRSG